MKVDSTGAILFLKDKIDFDFTKDIISVVCNPDSTFTFIGYSFPQVIDDFCAGSHGDQEIWTGKFDKNGNYLWTKFFGGTGTDGPGNIIPTAGGGYLIIGDANTNDGNATEHHGPNYDDNDAWIIKIDDNGKLEWQKSLGGDKDEYLSNVIQMPNHDFIITGATESYNNGDIFNSKGDYDGFLFKIATTNSITGTVFLDANANHIKDNDEPWFINGTVQSVKGSLVSASDIKNGQYANNVDTGTYITKPVLSLNYYTPYPLADTSRFNSYLQTDTANFAMVPVGAINDLRVTLLPASRTRPGFNAQYRLKYENVGTTTLATGSVNLVKDSRTSFHSASVNPATQVADTIAWNFSGLKPFASAEILIELSLQAPPGLNNNDTLHHYAVVNPIAGDSTPINNRDDIRQAVTGSFDPNDKTETHGNGFEEQMIVNGEYLNYLIRFQNTGTDTAFRVIVRDTLSNRMDWNSFEMISASHPYTLAITDQNKLEWKFDPIVLPDSNHNNAASNGYVAFRIKPKSTLVQGDTIFNKAGIYFDFNLPVITNLQQTVIAAPSLGKPAINGLVAEYCRKSQIVAGKIANLQPPNTGVITVVKLDNATLTVAGDGSFSFDIAALTAGNHNLSVRFTLGNTTTLTEWPFTVTAPGVLDLNLSANNTNITSASQSLIITGANATGGSNLRYTYAKDRSFTNILQADGSSNTLTVDPANLIQGVNWIYGRISSNGQCYTTETNIDSIQIAVNFVTGVVDVDAPGRSIKVYPVPFNEYLLLKGFNLAKKYEITLVNAQGSRFIMQP